MFSTGSFQDGQMWRVKWRCEHVKLQLEPPTSGGHTHTHSCFSVCVDRTNSLPPSSCFPLAPSPRKEDAAASVAASCVQDVTQSTRPEERRRSSVLTCRFCSQHLRLSSTLIPARFSLVPGLKRFPLLLSVPLPHTDSRVSCV